MEKFIYIFIEVDLWLILFFFKVENSGGMGGCAGIGEGLGSWGMCLEPWG